MSVDYPNEKHPRFGTRNPERADVSFWLEMIEERLTAYGARQKFADPQRDDGAVWTFDRFGMTRTMLPDGSIINIGGECEDFYDPDFHIYNDVIVRRPDGAIEIYLYPKDVFPPTDFHSATLVGDTIYLVGALGYSHARIPGTTPVYRLDLKTKRIERVATSGAAPGWVSAHRAAYDPERREIAISGGHVQMENGKPLADNVDDYRLRLDDGLWVKATDRHWPTFRVYSPSERWIDKDAKRSKKIDDFLPALPHALVDGDPTEKEAPDYEKPIETAPAGWLVREIVVQGIAVRYAKDLDAIRLRIQGEPPSDVVTALVEDLRAKLAAALKSECRVDRL